MKEAIKELESQRIILRDRLKAVEDAINALQMTCPHVDEEGHKTMNFSSSGPYNDVHRCTICGKTETR